MEKDECCPKFNPNDWNEKTLNWKSKPFIKESIPTFFHIPLGFMIGKKITKMYFLAKNAKANPPKKEWLVLFYDPHAFKTELYMSVTKPVEKANNTTLTGNFMTKVFDGPYSSIPKFIKEMDEYLSQKNKKKSSSKRGQTKPKKYYVHYAYCPKCAKKYKHNYMVLFAEV